MRRGDRSADKILGPPRSDLARRVTSPRPEGEGEDVES
jgi:hypothetical protein